MQRVIECANKLNLQVIDIKKEVSSCEDKITLKDEYNYLYLLSLSNMRTLIRRNGTPAIFFNLNPYTKANIINCLKINNINITLLTEDFTDVKAITKMKFLCPIHGEFIKSWNEIKNGQYCPICGRQLNAENKKNKYEDIKEGFKKLGYLLISKEYKSNQESLEYICLKHKSEGIQKMSWASLITGQRCSFCTKENKKKQVDIYKTSPKSHERFAQQIQDIYGNKFTFIEKYVDCKTKIKMYCNDCHSEFYAKPNHLLEGHLSCDCKSKSLGEDLIKEWLIKNKVLFEREYRIKECRNKKPLPFDFAIFDNNNLILLIEFQGRQHFEDTGWSSNKEKSLKRLKNQIINDNIKREYCKTYNIRLLEIPYWQIGVINDVLNKEVN